jgi:hypothetical protein
MEQDFYTDDFEQLLKEKSDQFRMYPSKRVWHSIYNNLHPGRRWPSYAMSILLITSLILIGYLNTSDNTSANRFTIAAGNQPNANDKIKSQQSPSEVNKINHLAELSYTGSSVSEIIVASADPAVQRVNLNAPIVAEINDDRFIQALDNYIASNQIFADVATVNKTKTVKEPEQQFTEKIQENIISNKGEVVTINKINTEVITAYIPAATTSDITESKEINISELNVEEPTDKSAIITADKNILSQQEKSWIEHYAMYNKSPGNKWKDRVNIAYYVTPAVNYRKLTTNTKGSATPFANSDINHSISQKPGVGLEAGIGLEYLIAKNLRLKVGTQFNYTNYNINADQTNHPILTTILLTDTYTGYSYPSARSSTISNNYNASALQPVILHNRTYQVSIPVGFAYRMSGTRNVEWFAGASFQPTYVFGGNAHLLSTDLKNYVEDPSSIRSWNLNLGFETYMNYKLGTYNLQVGPQVRYQVYSTYRKSIALIEKPYAIGFKLGIVKGF